MACRCRLIWFFLAILIVPPASHACPEWSVQAPLAGLTLLLDGQAVNSHYVAVGERGHILVSQDKGQSWTQSKVPTCNLITALYMHDERLGWAVGHDAMILRTTDGGATWEIIHQAPELELPLLDIFFHNENEGVAIGAYGYYLESTDGGDTWSERIIAEEDDFHLNSLSAAGDGLMFIAAEAGVIYRSVDRGLNWVSLDSPYFGSWFAIHAVNEEIILIAGLRGNLFRSEDGGDSWSQVPTQTRATLTNIVELPSGQLVITALEGNLFVSVDQGISVSDRSLASRSGITSAMPVNDQEFLLTGEFGIRRFHSIE